MRAKDPGGHCEQESAPQEPEAEPAVQNEHVVEPAALQLPGPHERHDAELVAASSSAPDLPAGGRRGSGAFGWDGARKWQ